MCWTRLGEDERRVTREKTSQFEFCFAQLSNESIPPPTVAVPSSLSPLSSLMLLTLKPLDDSFLKGEGRGERRLDEKSINGSVSVRKIANN